MSVATEWKRGESLHDVLTRLGYTHEHHALDSVQVKRGGDVVFSATTSPYESTALWLYESGQVSFHDASYADYYRRIVRGEQEVLRHG